MKTHVYSATCLKQIRGAVEMAAVPYCMSTCMLNLPLNMSWHELMAPTELQFAVIILQLYSNCAECFSELWTGSSYKLCCVNFFSVVYLLWSFAAHLTIFVTCCLELEHLKIEQKWGSMYMELQIQYDDKILVYYKVGNELKCHLTD